MNANSTDFVRNAPSVDAAWAQFMAPGSAQAFVEAWFAVLMAEVPHLRHGLLLLEQRGGGFVRAAAWPDQQAPLDALTEFARRGAERTNETLIEAGPDDDRLVSYPVTVDGNLHALVALQTQRLNRADAERLMRRLYWAAGWLHGLVLRQREMDSQASRARAAHALETLAAIEDEPGLEPALRALANEILRRFDADRVAVALMGARRLRLRAVSETAEAERRGADLKSLVQAMEEARLQMRTLVFPPVAEDGVAILAAHRAHARQTGASGIVSIPVLHHGRVVALIALERMRQGAADSGFPPDSADNAEAVAGIVAPLVHLKRQEHRLVSGRLRAGLGKGLSMIFGRRHPALKLALLLVLVLGLALSLARGELTVSADATVRGQQQRSLVAPQDGIIDTAPLRAGDWVTAGQEIARLDDTDLRLEQIRWQAEIARLAQDVRQKMAEGDRAGIAIAEAQAASARAELDLVEAQLRRLSITAPFDGLIVEGDLSQRLGGPVSQGDVLFEVALGDDYTIALDIDEYDVGLVQPGSEGVLALAGLSGEPLAVRVDHLGAVAQADDGRNIFAADAALLETAAGLRPGLAGVAKLSAGQAPLVYIWVRPLWQRLSYLFWQWTP